MQELRLLRCAAALLLLTGCASAARTVADVRALDAESAARLVAEGGLLYEADNSKRNGYEYCTVASALVERGDLRLGIREASKALFLGESSRDACLVATAKRDLATAYLFAGHLERAREYAQDAITGSWSCHRNEPRVARPAQKVLGDVFLRQGRTAEAIRQYEQLEAGSDYWAQVATISRANAHLAGGNVRQAAELLARAKTAAAGNTTLAAMVDRGLGQLALIEGRHRDAAVAFERAAASATGADAAYHRMWALDGLARARLAAADQAGAIAAYGQAIASAEQVRVRFRSEEFRTGFFGEIQHIFDRAVALLVDAGDAEGALAVSEQSRARALEDLIRGRVSASAQGQVVAESAGRPAAPSDIRAALRPGLVLVEYHLTDQRAFAWTVRQGETRVASITAGRESLATQVLVLRNRIAARDPAAAEVSAMLYRLLVAPLHIGKDEQVVIVPHGPLHYLPFQALRGPSGYLIEERAISYAPSGSALRAPLARNTAAPSRVLAVG